MQIPVPIAIASCFLVTGTVWYLSTRDADFTTPPPESSKQEVAQAWKQSSQPSPQPTAPETRIPDLQENAPRLIKPKRPKPSLPKLLPLGELHHAPAIGEYRPLGSQGSAAMIFLAQTLEEKQQPTRALLAWERVIDSTPAKPKQIQKASQAIARLSQQNPPWNADPNSPDIQLRLQAGATMKDIKNLELALQSAADTIEQASGHLLQLSIRVTPGRGTPIPAPRVPVALWISRPDAGNDQAETSPISFLASPDDNQALQSQCLAAIYNLVKARLGTDDNTAPAMTDIGPQDAPSDFIRQRITRLMWLQFAGSLK